MKNLFLILVSLMLLSSGAHAQDTANRSEFTLPSGVSVTIIEVPFDRSKFKIDGCSGPSSPCFIDGHIPNGAAIDLPKTYVKSITVSFKGHSYRLDSSDMYDAWGNRPLEMKGSRYFGGQCTEVGHCQFRGLFSDTIGTFVGEWIIVNGTSFRTVISANDDIIDLFEKHIDPPEDEQ